MTIQNDGGGSELPTPSVDPPELPRPDEIDTWSPGITDESGEVHGVSPTLGGDDPHEPNER